MSLRTLACIAAITLPISLAGAAPRAVNTTFPTPDAVIAEDVLRPARSDSSPMIQDAINRVAKRGGGTVFLTAGQYSIATPIVLSEGVTLRGDRPRTSAPGPVRGTILAITTGMGQADGPPAITVERGTGITDLSIWYPGQSSSKPVPYPWTIAGSTRASGDNYTVHDVTLVNPYRGMRFGPEWNELHTVRNVVGTPINRGIFVDTCTDIGRLTNITFAPTYWARSGLPGAPASAQATAALGRSLLSGGIGVEMGRSDWEYLYGVSVSGYSQGYLFRPGAQGTTNAVMYGCSATACGEGLVVRQMNPIGLSATHCAFQGTRAGVRCEPAYNATLQLNSCNLASSAGPAVGQQGQGFISIVGGRCNGAAGVTIAGGMACLLGVAFARPDQAVQLGVDVVEARVVGCVAGPRGRDRVQVVAGSPSRVQVSHASAHLTPCPRVPLVGPETRGGPGSRAVIMAAAFGVRPASLDNTAALQKVLALAANTRGTVYLQAGYYRCTGSLVVPEGVELRGSFDVPHHTVSGGTVFMVTGGRGNGKGTPFVRLRRGAALRGVSFWYPEQSILAPVAYPWTIQSMGPRCRLVDVNIGNAWQGVDFFSHDSTGHRITYLSGGYLRRGLFVSKSASGGVVEDVQFNPHYVARIPADFPHPAYSGDPFGKLIDFQQANLEGIVLGHCVNERVDRTFLYSAIDGLRFVGDRGGFSGSVVNHGTDAGSRAITFESISGKGLDLINTQLVILGKSMVASIVSTPGFNGSVRLFNSQLWAPGKSARLEGPGSVVLQQFNTLTGPFDVLAGSLGLEGGYFQGGWRPAVTLEGRTRSARIIAATQKRGFLVDNPAHAPLATRANSPAPAVMPGNSTFRSGFEPGDPAPLVDRPAPAGGIRSVSGSSCRVVTGRAHSGSASLRLAGSDDEEAHSFIYYLAFNTSVRIQFDSVLTYWVLSANELSRKVGVDLVCADGSTLRDQGIADTSGQAAHPGATRGRVGQWARVTVPLGTMAGAEVTGIMVAHDAMPGKGPFEALFDDIEITRKAR